MKPIRILLVDDHAIIRMGLASLLNSHAEFEVVGDAGDGLTAVRKASKLKPDVIIMDLVMPELDGTETTRKILEQDPAANILILTTFGTSDSLGHALEAGAKGAILKNAQYTELATAIRQTAAGKSYVSAEIRQILSDEPPLPELSARQQEILESIIRGLTNEDIARQLQLTLPMVKEHISAIFCKLGAANRAEAVAIALRKHLLKI